MNNFKLYLFFTTSILTFNVFSQTTLIKDENLQEEKYLVLKEKILKEKSVKQFTTGDTLYIYFNKAKETSIWKISQEYSNKKIDTIINYNFKLKDSSKVGFIYKRYQDFDAMEDGENSIIKKAHKGFLVKNKRNILTCKFFKKNRSKEVSYLLAMLEHIISVKKVLFIIDENEIKNKTITIRQVNLNRSSNINLMVKI
ncbi:hypothetical protein [Olleya sp. Bg11-27]|uniref:hypothetical protein n=1 Tax=Olleya sp. Bg11-27 TaxID=2058135 RepID=UPI000C306B66|nr:hypothetical protein [Olleya sp. Bg11-27]AUC75695.1 hypothetical protein CW732_08415 [Olleya sp. Bg11-27]